MSRLFELDPDTCVRLLNAGVFGRVAVCTPDGPEVVPVNYTTVDGAILIRTSPDSLLARHADGGRAAFELDYVNYERGHGWSVIARGPVECLTEDQLAESERAVPEPQPWAQREDPLWIRLRWNKLTGRRVGQGWDLLAELPVRRRAWPR